MQVFKNTKAPSILRRRNLKTQPSPTITDHHRPSPIITDHHRPSPTITYHFGFVFEETSIREITRLSWRHRFCFPSTRKRKACVFKFLRFEERSNGAAFSNFSGVVWTLPKYQNNLWGVRKRQFLVSNPIRALDSLSGYHGKKVNDKGVWRKCNKTSWSNKKWSNKACKMT